MINRTLAFVRLHEPLHGAEVYIRLVLIRDVLIYECCKSLN